MKALQSCLSRFMNACTDMLEKYNDIRQEEVSLRSFSFMSYRIVLVDCGICLNNVHCTDETRFKFKHRKLYGTKLKKIK